MVDLDMKMTEEKEGATTFLMCQDAERIYDASVFYNPKMTFNRDLTILILSSIISDSSNALTFLDPFAGTGVRSYRILNELPSGLIKRVIASDRNPMAIEMIKRNIEKNKLEDRLEVIHSDAFEIIAKSIETKTQADVIDIDPFGSPILFLEIAIRALQKNEGFLFITATDLQVLCGKFSEACFRIYNAIPTRYYLCHEVALRILIYNLLISAGRLGVAIDPVFSYNHEHFLRVKVKIVESKEKANEQHKDIGFVHFCTDCSYVKYYRIRDEIRYSNCPICMKKLEKAGPLWLGNLYNRKYIEIMKSELENFDFSTGKQIRKLLDNIIEEIDSPPFFYFIPYILRSCKKQGITLLQLIESLQQKGFIVSRTVFNPEGLKTNASYADIVDAIKMY
ncbi:MAG: tRNA (guanine(10)-N(2))-dimethyltransferase [Candidatus Heimdallarchaeota archaeon]|nr:tRNA (guanine(10)-N(2))-dimethyltransferase [Candidatus Heimdallarchaeota archaeon]MCK4954872.1 tRNA (guanine(10)-N(2))-dimethyltransferase [Candidatus Heimdallarchaeota archaeon]